MTLEPPTVVDGVRTLDVRLPSGAEAYVVEPVAGGAGAAILFKGSGFYQTDYRSDSYKKGAQAEKASSSDTSSKSSDSSSSAPKADSKPAGGSTSS